MSWGNYVCWLLRFGHPLVTSLLLNLIGGEITDDLDINAAKLS